MYIYIYIYSKLVRSREEEVGYIQQKETNRLLRLYIYVVLQVIEK